MAKQSSVNIIVSGHSYDLPIIGAIASLKPDKPQPMQVVEKVQGLGELMEWGENNDFPNLWELEIEKNDTLRDAIEKEIDRIYAGGLEYGYMADDGNGGKIFKSYENAEIDDLLYSDISIYGFEQIISDYVKHRFPMPELIFNKEKTKVSAICGFPAPHSRFNKQDTLGYIPWLYLNRNWQDGQNPDSPNTKKIPILDPFIDTPEVIKIEKKTLSYAFLIRMAGWRTYYSVSPAYAAKTGRWLDISAKVTATYEYMLSNQMNPKYHIEIDAGYMAKKYGDRWAKATSDEHNIMMLEELRHFHKMLHGPENTGNNIITIKQINSLINKEYSEWTVTPFKGSVFDSGYIELLSQADKHIQKAVGLDPSLQGDTGGSKMGGGSGSDKRESFNIRMATAQRHVDKILSPYYWAIRYNGYKGPNGEKIVLQMKTPYLQTLNQVTPSERTTKLPGQ